MQVRNTKVQNMRDRQAKGDREVDRQTDRDRDNNIDRHNRETDRQSDDVDEDTENCIRPIREIRMSSRT